MSSDCKSVFAMSSNSWKVQLHLLSFSIANKPVIKIGLPILAIDVFGSGVMHFCGIHCVSKELFTKGGFPSTWGSKENKLANFQTAKCNINSQYP